MWQALRTELHPQGVEVVTVGLEVDGADTAGALIDAAAPDHPSLIDTGHQLSSLFGVVNIPSVIWIDEDGMIVRPAEPGWAGPASYPQDAIDMMGQLAATAAAGDGPNIMEIIMSGQDAAAYPDAIRDWAAHGTASRFALTPDEVVARSQPRSTDESAAAAHFELASALWNRGSEAEAIEHFNAAHRLQPANWAYKRQAWSLVSRQQGDGLLARFQQGPLAGAEAEWPFEADFRADLAELGLGEYYPNTFD